MEPEERAGTLDAFGPGFVSTAVALLAIAAALGLAWLEIAFTSAGAPMTWFALR